MKESDESIPDEVLLQLINSDIEHLELPRPDTPESIQVTSEALRAYVARSHDPQNFLRLGIEIARFDKDERWMRVKTLLVGSLRQDKDAGTETEDSFDSASESTPVNFLPPANAEFLLALFLDKANQEAAIGCFAELYSKRVLRWGESRARLWAWVQVGKTLLPVLKRVVLKVTGLFAAYEWLKHHLS